MCFAEFACRKFNGEWLEAFLFWNALHFLYCKPIPNAISMVQ